MNYLWRSSLPLAILIGLSFTAPPLLAQTRPSDRIPGRFVCQNNPAPECRHPDRPDNSQYRCVNNPNPDCNHPDRPSEPEPGSWSCVMNQNVTCDNPIRYSVEEPEAWPEYFEDAPEE